ncbi:hypothetical protein [Actinoplanes sp. NPDC049118]|uniref:hypothetical protein n=1 Tax=Actinoplanes sp. NPDC049118 TaxID=3155769 RepID=UPI0033D6CE7E
MIALTTGGLMSAVFWSEAARLMWPRVPVALVFVVGLLVTIALRRRLGAGARVAIGGFALLALAGLGRIGWGLWTLSLWDELVEMTSESEPRQSAGMEIYHFLNGPLDLAFKILYLVGLACVTAAVFVGRKPRAGRPS